jgi:hypothetical protein
LGFFVFAGLGFADGLGEAVSGDDDHTIAVANDDIARMNGDLADSDGLIEGAVTKFGCSVNTEAARKDGKAKGCNRVGIAHTAIYDQADNPPCLGRDSHDFTPVASFPKVRNVGNDDIASRGLGDSTVEHHIIARRRLAV